MIRIENLYKTYNNNFKALEDINIHIEKGDIYGIVGLSGAGKSTLVRCINRLEEADSGKIMISGQDILTLNKKELREQRKKIGMIFQNFNLFYSKSVYENIAYPLKLAGKSKTEIDKRVNELLEIVSLNSKANSYPSMLSGGQKQRVGIARAIANAPDVLLCDEATSALDPKTTSQILSLLLEINKKTNITIVVITHEMDVIRQICNKVAILEHGRIVENGHVLDIFSKPSTDVTKHFIDMEFHILEKFKNNRLLSLTFTSKVATSAVISKISRDLEVDINILSGSISTVQNETIGKLCVEISDESDIDRIKYEFTKYHVRVEEFND